MNSKTTSMLIWRKIREMDFHRLRDSLDRSSGQKLDREILPIYVRNQLMNVDSKQEFGEKGQCDV
jgi:hypothetical protein